MTVASTTIARTIGLTTNYANTANGTSGYTPQVVAVIAQGASASTYATTKFQATSAAMVGTTVGFGSPAHLAAEQLMPRNGDGLQGVELWIYPLEDHASGVASAGDITPSGTAAATATYYVRLGGVLSEPFTIPAGAITVADVVDSMVAAINAVPGMPMIATDGTTVLDLESKWQGASANDILIEVIAVTSGNGVSFAITQPASGATNPDVTTATDQIGTKWVTMIVNGLDIADTTTLGLYQTYGEGRWGTNTHKPLVVFTGNTEADQATSVAVPDARPTDRINAQIPAPGSPNLPIAVAARAVSRIAQQANDNAPVDYGGLELTGIIPGTDAQNWDDTTRDVAIKAGSSTVEKTDDGVLILSDVVTFYKPTDEDPPAYRYVVDIAKLQTCNYRTFAAFNAPDWKSAPLLPAGQLTDNPAAKTEDMAVALMTQVNDGLARDAVLSDPAYSAANTTATINSSNAKRLDIVTARKLSGNTNVLDIVQNFQFYYGGSAA